MADPIVIVDREGTEHEFPPGFDPKQAALIVSKQSLAKANATPLQSPSTYEAGFKEGLKPIARAGLDALPGIGAMVGGAISTPETLGTGTIPGVALGAAAGRGARDLIGHATGIDAPTSPMQKAGHMAVDAAIAGGTQAVIPGLAEAVKAPVQTLRDASEQFGEALPPSLRRLGRLLPSLPPTAGKTPIVSPDWLAGDTSGATSAAAPPSAPAPDVMTIHGSPVQIGQGTRDLMQQRGMVPVGASPVEAPIQAPHPLTAPRVDVGAEVVGRQSGMTKQAVRDVTGPILGEAPGEASPVFPEKPLHRMIDTMKALPKTGAERTAYVQAARDPKTMAQLENLRRTLAHLGLVGTAAVGTREALLNGMQGDQ